VHVLYLEYESSTYDITDIMKMLGSGENHRNKTLKKKVKKEGVGSVKKLTDIYETPFFKIHIVNTTNH
jgi:hypothetical protein